LRRSNDIAGNREQGTLRPFDSLRLPSTPFDSAQGKPLRASQGRDLKVQKFDYLALLNWRMIFGGRDVPWNVSTKILNVCKIIFIPKISNADYLLGVAETKYEFRCRDVSVERLYIVWLFSPSD
jgi:hypothetical protein